MATRAPAPKTQVAPPPRCAHCDNQALAALKSPDVTPADKRILAGLVPHIASALEVQISCPHCGGAKGEDDEEKEVAAAVGGGGERHIEASVSSVVARLRRHLDSDQVIVKNIAGIIDVFNYVVLFYAEDQQNDELVTFGRECRAHIQAKLQLEPHKLDVATAGNLVDKWFAREWNAVIGVALGSLDYINLSERRQRYRRKGEPDRKKRNLLENELATLLRYCIVPQVASGANPLQLHTFCAQIINGVLNRTGRLAFGILQSFTEPQA